MIVPWGPGHLEFHKGLRFRCLLKGQDFTSLSSLDQSLFSLGFSFFFCEMRRGDEPGLSGSLPAPIATVSTTCFGT